MLDDKPRSRGLADSGKQSSGIGRLLYMLTFVCKPPNSILSTQRARLYALDELEQCTMRIK